MMYWVILELENEITYFEPYLGKDWSRDSIEEFCQDLHTQFTYLEQRDVFIQRVVDVLTKGCVYWLDARKFEWE